VGRQFRNSQLEKEALMDRISDNLPIAVWTAALMFLILTCPVNAFAHVSFERTYGGDSLDMAWCVRQTTDRGFIIAGCTCSFGTGDADVYLIKTDSLGEVLWEKSYRNDGWDEAYCIQQTMDGGFIVTGYAANGLQRADVWLAKTDSMGDTTWSRMYGSPLDDGGSFVQQTPDRGYIVVGDWNHFMAPSGDMYAIKTDSSGHLLWDRTYGGADVDAANFVQRTQDGGFILAGETASFGAGKYDMYLVKTDSLGNPLWDTTYGGNQDDRALSAQQTSDGGYILAGYNWSVGRVYLVKTDSSGSLVWDHTYTHGDSSVSSAWSVQQTLDGGYIVAGWISDSFGMADNDVYVVKTDSVGNTLWEWIYGGWSEDEAYCVRQTMDGGYIIVGETHRSYGTGGADVYLLKLAPDGTIAKDASIVSIDTPGDTVFCDSTYEVKATVGNIGDAVFSFDVVASIGSYADTIPVHELTPGSAIQVSFRNWQVPSSDSVTYDMTVRAYAANDVDTTDNRMSKTIFAYNPAGVSVKLGRTTPARSFELYRNEPNPFHGSTTITYSLPGPCHVSLKVYDITGRPVEAMVDQNQEAGAHQLRWHAENRANGIYFCRLQAGEKSATRKMISLR
jgi:hypothetical protein